MEKEARIGYPAACGGVVHYAAYVNYDTGYDFSALMGGTVNSSGNLLSDYASIKNGSYGKLLKAYYAKQDAENASMSGDSAQKLTLMRLSADSLKKSADALNNSSLWEKKKIKKKDEKTGEENEVEDYDWTAITKAVKSFVDDYNSVVGQAGDSDTKNVLRNATWLTGITDKAGNLLSKVGITIGKGNKLELDEDALKEANISTLKLLFTGHGSFIRQIIETYGNNAKLRIIKSFLEELPELEQVINRKELKELPEEERKRYIKSRFRLGYGNAFYLQLYIKHADYTNLLSALSESEFDTLLLKCKVSKKTREKYMKLYIKYQSLTEETKKMFNEVILYNPYRTKI